MARTLDSEHIRRLTDGKTDEGRAEAAAGVAAAVASGDLNDTERGIALDIVAILTRDAAEKVRMAMVDHLRHCSFLPNDVAVRIAFDIEHIAIPFIEATDALTDDDLMRLIKSDAPARQSAVARRAVVSTEVSNALIDTGHQEAVHALLQNAGADISARSLHQALTAYAGNKTVEHLMIHREALPLTVSARLIAGVSGVLRRRLITHHGLPPTLADELAKHGREGALVKSLEGEQRGSEVEKFAQLLHTQRRLSPSLLLRALCLGDLHFVEACFATMTHMSVEEARGFLFEKGPGGVRILFDKARLPQPLFRAFASGLEEINVIRARNPEKGWRKDYTQQIVWRLVRDYKNVCPDDLEHVLSQLSRYVNRTPPEEREK